MNKDQKEVCQELIFHANTKGEVVDAMKETFPGLDKTVISEYVYTQWKKKLPVNKISLRNTEYADRFTILSSLLFKKEMGVIKKIKIRLRKSMNPKLSKESYAVTIGSLNLNQPGREQLRGQLVEFHGFSPNKMRIQVSALDPNAIYDFSIWDINAGFYIETE